MKTNSLSFSQGKSTVLFPQAVSFRCSVSGHHVMGFPVHALDINGVDHPISNTVYVRILNEVPRSSCGTDENSVGVINYVSGSRNIEFCVSLHGLKSIPQWRDKVDILVLATEEFVHQKQPVVSSSKISCGVLSQEEFEFS